MHKRPFRLLRFFYPLSFLIYVTYFVRFCTVSSSEWEPCSSIFKQAPFPFWQLSKWLRYQQYYGAFLETCSAVELKFCKNKQKRQLAKTPKPKQQQKSHCIIILIWQMMQSYNIPSSPNWPWGVRRWTQLP